MSKFIRAFSSLSAFAFTSLVTFHSAPVHAEAAAGKSVTLATLDWEPYIGEKLKDNGFIAVLVKAAFERSGYKAEAKFLPWARAVLEAKEGVHDALFPEYMDDGRKPDFVFSDPFPGGPLGFFKRKGQDIKFAKLEDLKPYRIGVVRGYVNTTEFDAAEYLKKEAATDDETNLKKLASSRLDLVVIDRYVAEYILKTKLPQFVDKLEFMTPVLEEKALYVAMSKKAPDSAAKLAAFNEGLKKLKADGTLDKILATRE